MLQAAHARREPGTLVALIEPHAGYVYSGQAAAEGYTLLDGLTFPTVVIVGPSHREYFRGVSVFPGEAYRTPLGDVPLAHDLRKQLLAHAPWILVSEAGHRSEHAIEVQLPFLQQTLGSFSFLPLVLGDQRREVCDMLGTTLADVLQGRDVLLIASSDLSHYHPYHEAVALDRSVIEAVEAFDDERLMHDLEREVVEACGGGPMVAVMQCAKRLGATRSHVLTYYNSGDVTGQHDAVVGYLCAAFYREPADKQRGS